VEENVTAHEWGKFVGYSAKYAVGLRRDLGWPWLECVSTGIEAARIKIQEERTTRLYIIGAALLGVMVPFMRGIK
jgi:hypothetical protein